MVSIQAASLKRRARERQNRLQRQNKKKLRDLGEAESNAAMQQAARSNAPCMVLTWGLIRIMHAPYATFCLLAGCFPAPPSAIEFVRVLDAS